MAPIKTGFSKALPTVVFAALAFFCSAPPAGAAPDREQTQKLFKDGNWKEAYDGYRELVLEPKTSRPDDIVKGLQCLNNLGRQSEIDEFLESVAKANEADWSMLRQVGQSYFTTNHFGFMVAGEFHRGHHRGGGKWVSAQERDRVRALQLMDRARELAVNDDSAQGNQIGALFTEYARYLVGFRGYDGAWRLQYLTDLNELPDYSQGRAHYGGGGRGAPVDEEGNPVYHRMPPSFEEATTDGQRWRWLMMQAMEYAPGQKPTILNEFAQFLRNQFGVQTLHGYPGLFGPRTDDDSEEARAGIFALHTLSEDETIAKLATGVKRFEIPEEFNFISIYREMVGMGQAAHGYQPWDNLARIFADRRQYPKAADCWRQAIDAYGPGHGDFRRKQLDQIVGNWARFEQVGMHSTGMTPDVDLVYRNGDRVEFEAYAVKVEDLLNDVKDYIKSRPNRLNWQQINIRDIGRRLVWDNQEKYIGDRVSTWSMPLDPAPEHFDRRVTVPIPLKQPGAYLVVADMKDGNTTRIIVWIADTAIVEKRLDQKNLYFIADAETGKAIPRATVEFFGYRQEWKRKTVGRGSELHIHVSQFAEFSDADGMVIPSKDDLLQRYNWLITATTEDGRFAYMGFNGVWYNRIHDAEYKQTKVYTITDRPVYRPEHTVKFKVWVRHAQYDKEDVSQFAGQTFTVRIVNAKNEEVYKQQLKADDYGGMEGEYQLPDEAALGVYSLQVGSLGGGSFRVEEYKKPEFEVTVEAPDKPVMLGEEVKAKVSAKYYFGSPVTKGKVTVRVERYSHSAQWYPIAPWDWFYGRGYWWFAYDYEWYPGWHDWCMPAPHWWWYPAPNIPPELVVDMEQEVGPDGTVEVEIDTALAKELHGHTDHRYKITAEVTDESRRTIVGTGQVLVARKPFEVYAWVDRGHYRQGDTIHASFQAQTLDSRPVQGRGKLTLYSLSYDDKGTPKETPVQEWQVDTGAEGSASQKMVASRPGQYRISYMLKDEQGHEIEGGYIFVVAGEGFDGREYRFNHLELVPDKQDYAPGDTIEIRINTERAGSTVLFFVRPSNGVCLAPELLRLDGKSIVRTIEVSKKDMPNFFVEALTVSDGKVHTAVREIVVPPEKRVLNVEVVPSKEEFLPGEQASIQLKLTDFFGEPFMGSMALSVYDKSVEYISGGSNVPEIREFFWKWRRHHRPHTIHSLQPMFDQLLKQNEIGMSFLGAFGHVLGDRQSDQVVAQSGPGLLQERGGAMRMSRAVGMAKGAAPEDMAMLSMDAAAPPMAAEMAEGGEAGMAAGATPGTESVPAIRKEFADTAFWKGTINTDEKGLANIAFDMPENLTGWKMLAWGMGHGTKVGQGEASAVTRKNIILRLQAPRFFVETDEVVLSANIHNYLADAKAVRAVLELDGGCIEPITDLEQRIRIDAGGEQRVDWRIKVVREGEAVIRMKALTDVESDAMEMKFPVYVHGMDKMVSYSGVIRPEGEKGVIEIDVPAERRVNESRLVVNYSPTLAGAMVDALPYLVEYPYGCTEQTLNRFVPTVITHKILLDMGLDLEVIKEKQNNLNAQELGDAQERAAQWQRWNRNPVFDAAEVRRMVKEGVKALTSMQNSDGGWGWFSGWGERSYPHTTAVVVHGLKMARDNDVAIVPGVLDNGLQWLKRYQDEQVRLLLNHEKKLEKKRWKSPASNLDALIYMILTENAIDNTEMRRYLYRDRNTLAVYGKAAFGIGLHTVGDEDKLTMVLRNIEQFLVTDDENQTAYLKLPNSDYWWYWYGGEIEAHAFYLKLLARTEPKSEKAAGLVKYLLNNRKHATYWNSTRDTAYCIEAMAEYMRASGEDKPDMTVKILVDGKQMKEVKITPDTLFQFDSRFVLFGDAVDTGKHRIELIKNGTGPLYYNAYLSYFTLEDFITKAGLEVKVERRVFKLEQDREATTKAAGSRGQALDQKILKYKRIPLDNGGELKSGDLVEVELIIESKNDYEYIVVEDMKGAGFEPVDVRSGYTGNEMGAYVEFRDERVAFFVRVLARGKHSVTYRMRAEIPGAFSALPTRISAMYAPELRGNSDEFKVKITD